MKKLKLKTYLKLNSVFLILIIGLFFSNCAQSNGSDDKDLIQIFHHERPPSMETLEVVNEFLEAYADKYEIKYYMIKDDKNNELLKSLGLPEDHFPFAIAINGKTSAEINGETIIFVNLPDFMHHIGRREGNWSLDYLKTVLENKDLLLTDNPTITTEALKH